MAKLNIFTCADNKYEDFSPIFIAACLWSNPDVTVEIGVEDASSFAEVHRQAMTRLTSVHGENAFLIRNANWQTPDGLPIRPGSVRFITEPMLPSEYVYISDIDIITLEPDIADRHIAFMARTGLPYSNWVRTGSKRLTGLHFCRRDWQYPLPRYDSSAPSRVSDEKLLYMLVRRKLGFDPPTAEKFRPVHGIHISPNRAPQRTDREGRAQPVPGWFLKPYRKSWRKFRGTQVFRDLEPHLSDRIRTFISQIDELTTPPPAHGANTSGVGIDL